MKDEKSRGGENVEFDEKANEDRYFALLEHERINEMKAEFHKGEAERRAALAMNCPKCPGQLERYSFMGFVLERCAGCEGIWLFKGQLHEITRKASRGRLEAFLDRCFSKDETNKNG